uniref:Uncharacterized protein n=1 Tax=Anguilla anguilla TaxID=7936 RepID=A0A0E9XXX9_ANGAN
MCMLSFQPGFTFLLELHTIIKKCENPRKKKSIYIIFF